jgi:hypothetical protein
MRAWVCRGLLALALVVAREPVARADGDPDVTRLASGRSQKTNWVPPGTEDRYGRAEVLVHAPLATVKELVLDFAGYRLFVPNRFHNVHVIGKDQGGTDVYMQVPIMNGLVTLWQVMRWRDVKPLAPGWAIVEGLYAKGNLKTANAAWTLRRVDDTTTLVQFDLLIVPLVPAPQALVDEELRDAAMQAVDNIRDRAQAAPGPVPYEPAPSTPRS